MGTWLLSLLRRLPGSLDIIGLTIAIVVLAFLFWPGWLRQAREDGAAQERLKWVAEMEDARAKRDAAVAAAQRKLDDAEGRLLVVRASNDLKINDLEAALSAERADNAKAEKASEGASVCKSRPMPDRVRNALNAFRPG